MPETQDLIDELTTVMETNYRTWPMYAFAIRQVLAKAEGLTQRTQVVRKLVTSSPRTWPGKKPVDLDLPVIGRGTWALLNEQILPQVDEVARDIFLVYGSDEEDVVERLGKELYRDERPEEAVVRLTLYLKGGVIPWRPLWQADADAARRAPASLTTAAKGSREANLFEELQRLSMQAGLTSVQFAHIVACRIANAGTPQERVDTLMVAAAVFHLMMMKGMIGAFPLSLLELLAVPPSPDN